VARDAPQQVTAMPRVALAPQVQRPAGSTAPLRSASLAAPSREQGMAPLRERVPLRPALPEPRRPLGRSAAALPEPRPVRERGQSFSGWLR